MKPVIEAIIRWYDNGIYYPNTFLIIFAVVVLAVAGGMASLLFHFYPSLVSWILRRMRTVSESVQKKLQLVMRKHRKSQTPGFPKPLTRLNMISQAIAHTWRFGILWLQNNESLIFILLLAITVYTRFYISYSDRIIAAPEKIFQLDPIGRDLYSGVYDPSLTMVGGQGFYGPYSAVGSGVLLIAGPFIHNYLFKNGFCSYTQLGCHYEFYRFFLRVSFIGYLLLLMIILQKTRNKTKFAVLLYALIFFLGIPGSLGVERGNIDILLSLTVGFLLLLLIQLSKRRFPASAYLALSLLIGFLGGFLTNAKIFLLPFALIAVVASPSPLIAVLMSAVTFFSLSEYLPNVLYRIPATVYDLLLANTEGVKGGTKLFFEPGRLAVNHSFEAIASLFTNCTFRGSCIDNSWDSLKISMISISLLLVVFVFPIVPLVVKLIRNTRHQFLWACLRIYHLRRDRRVILFMFIVADAVINLIPQTSYAYRLFYSLPIVLIAYREATMNPDIKWYVYLSMIFLAIKGFWIYYILNFKGWTIYDPRAMSLFVILHFYFLMKSGLMGAERSLKERELV